jgi:superfamily II DNA/RNA helicase
MQLKALLAADAKLEAFLKEIVTLLSDSENRIVVYCTSQSTVNYVSKALWACNGGKKGICVYDSNSTDAEFVRAEFDGTGAEEPNIIVADDSAGSRFLGVEKITHIINYEYPESPLVLEQRLTRAGRKAVKNNNPAFYIFCDEDYKFDGRMLRKTVLSNFGSAFSAVSDKSLLFDFENIEEHLIVLICELKFIAENAKSDIVESFRVEYNAPEVKNVKDAAATAKKRLERLVGVFGLNDVLKQGAVNDEQLFMQISEKIQKLKGKKVSLDAKGVLQADGASKPAGAKELPETKKAADYAKKLTGKKEDFEQIKNEIAKLHDSQKLSVLISVWKYFKYELKIPKSYKEFMKLYDSIMKG